MDKRYNYSLKESETIPLCEPKIQGNEWQYIKDCLDTNWVSSAGKYVNQFEQSLADYLDRRYAVACVNCTASLHIALLISGIKPDEEVLLPTLTFIAPANAVRYIGAWPTFIDVQPDIWQMDPQKVIDFLTKECKSHKGLLINRITGRTVRAILPVHLLGHPVDMQPILDVARRFGLVVIEDVAESLGASYKDQKVGTLGDIACLSFNGNKTVTAGGGGMLVTQERTWADKARYLVTQAKDDPLEFIHNEIGYNYRLSNLHAAMGLAQMEHLEEYIAAKRRIAERYNKSLRDFPGITLPIEASWAKSTFWLYTVSIDALRYGMDSRNLLRRLEIANIQCRPLWHPLHTLKPFENCCAYKVEVAEKLYHNTLCLPSSVGLRPEQQDRIIEVFHKK